MGWHDRKFRYREPFEEFLKYWSGKNEDYGVTETPEERVFYFSGKLVTRMGEKYTIENENGNTHEIPSGVLGEFDPFFKKSRINKDAVDSEGSSVEKLTDHYYRGKDFREDLASAVQKWDVMGSPDSTKTSVLIEFYHNLTALPGVEEGKDYQQEHHSYQTNYKFYMDEERLREVAENHLTDENTLPDDLL